MHVIINQAMSKCLNKHQPGCLLGTGKSPSGGDRLLGGGGGGGGVSSFTGDGGGCRRGSSGMLLDPLVFSLMESSLTDEGAPNDGDLLFSNRCDGISLILCVSMCCFMLP